MFEQARPEFLGADLAGIERHLQRLVRLVMRRVMETVMATIAATQVTVELSCAVSGNRVCLIERDCMRQLQGLVGDHTLHGPYFICDHCHHGIAPSARV